MRIIHFTFGHIWGCPLWITISEVSCTSGVFRVTDAYHWDRGSNIHHTLSIKLQMAALEYYNKTQKTNYKLDIPQYSNIINFVNAFIKASNNYCEKMNHMDMTLQYVGDLVKKYGFVVINYNKIIKGFKKGKKTLYIGIINHMVYFSKSPFINNDIPKNIIYSLPFWESLFIVTPEEEKPLVDLIISLHKGL